MEIGSSFAQAEAVGLGFDRYSHQLNVVALATITEERGRLGSFDPGVSARSATHNLPGNTMSRGDERKRG